MRQDSAGGTSTFEGELLAENDERDFQARWAAVERSFIDEPRASVAQADDLVAEVVKRIAALFEADRMLLERQWQEGQEASTEDLRLVLQRYRAFFRRLLSL